MATRPSRRNGEETSGLRALMGRTLGGGRLPGMKVRIGYGLGTRASSDPERFADLVDTLERHRFDSLWLSERVTGDCPDPIVGLAVAAGRTTKLKFGFSVLVLPGRNPMLLAKELATLDRLSSGRLLPAFGLGAVDPGEHQAFGVERGRAGQALRRGAPAAPPVLGRRGRRPRRARSTTTRAPSVRPLPHQEPLEIWLGGIAPSELQRCGRLGDGWLPSFCTPDDVRGGIPVIQRGRRRARPRDRPGALRRADPLLRRRRYPTSWPRALARDGPTSTRPRSSPSGLADLADMIGRHIEAGGSKFVVIPMVEPTDWDDHLAEVADTLLPLQN